jgi:hypothetical protein
MLSHPVNITIKAMIEAAAKEKAQLAEKIANNLDVEALTILADKSAKPGMSAKVKSYKHLM